jgi:glycosyltransferase involved in cell wall biosynthesis
MIRRPFQAWDRRTAARVTRFIANSRHTARRIAMCYGREADVVYPPVRTSFFTIDPAAPREDWYLLVSALEPYKRVDLAIRAAIERGLHLRIVGGGTQERHLRALARDAAARARIEFLGRVDDTALRSLYRTARALVHPQQEDFGIVAAEAQSCGCPVIAFAAGGALETVTAQSGIFFDDQTVVSMIDAIERFEAASFLPQDCRRSADRFAEARFDDAIDRHVRSLIGGAGVIAHSGGAGAPPSEPRIHRRGAAGR